MKSGLIFVIITAVLISCSENIPEGDVKFRSNSVLCDSSEDFEKDTAKGYFYVDIKCLRPINAHVRLRDSVNRSTNLFLRARVNIEIDKINEENINLDASVREAMIYWFDDVRKNMRTTIDCSGCRRYYLKIDHNIAYQNDSLISMTYDWKLYEGGDEDKSLYFVYCLTFNKKTGSQVTYDMLINNKEEFFKTAERKFREQTNTNPAENIFDKFIFRDNEFDLGRYFALTDSGMVLYYNPNEVAEQLIKIELDYDEIKDYLNFMN